MAPSNSVVFWRGPSPVDGAPILVAVSGIAKASDNSKTGDMAQSWIMRGDVRPTDAIKSGDDSSVCGGCQLRPFIVKQRRATGDTETQPCYVNVGHAPVSIWDAIARGNVPDVAPREAGRLAGSRGVRGRQGGYGDPANVPMAVWEEFEAGILESAPTGKPGTSYTHAWRETPAMARWSMASIDPTMGDTAAVRLEAKALGFRTYRVMPVGGTLQDGEIICPESSGRVQCADCGLCGGNRTPGAKDIAIPVIVKGGRKAAA